MENNTAESSGSPTKNKYTEEDLLFIESMCAPGKKKDWKQIYNKGKAQGFFQSYTTSHNLKTSYHHLQQKKKVDFIFKINVISFLLSFFLLRKSKPIL
jgi:hypothetical protein